MAVDAQATGSQRKANGATKWIGTRPVRPDGVDKVTGRARFGADVHLPNMLVGKVLRSPHAHARLKSIDTSRARSLPGVKAVVTRDDFDSSPSEFVPAGEMLVNYRDIVRNVMAREKALYEGHPVAAVAAVSERAAKEALDLIEVGYEVLPHVMDVEEAMARTAPLLHEDMITAGGGAGAGDAIQRREGRRVRAWRRRGRLRRSGRGGRARVPHPARAPGLHRTAFMRRELLRGRPGRAVVHDPGALHRARALRKAPGDGGVPAPRHRVRDRRRLRREDGGVPGAAGADALPQIRQPRQDDHVP